MTGRVRRHRGGAWISVTTLFSPVWRRPTLTNQHPELAPSNSDPAMVTLRCPFDAGQSVRVYATAEVPAWWPCTCGAEHHSQPATGEK
jgi:hypothetical protein